MERASPPEAAQPNGPEAAFDAYARATMVKVIPWFGVLIAVTALLWWPTDRLVFPDHPAVQAAFGQLRLGAIVANLLAVLILPRLAFARRHPAEVGGLVMVLQVAWAGYCMAECGPTPWNTFAFLYPAPMCTVYLLLPPARRLLATSIAVGAALGGWCLSPMGRSLSDVLPVSLSFLAFCGLVSLGLGHLLYVLVRQNFLYRLEFEAAAEHLEARVLEQTREVREMRRHANAARDDERMALARDLHDGLGQELTGVRLAVAAARAHLPVSAPPKLAEAVTSVSVAADAAAVTLRSVLSSVRASPLDELGLIPSLRRMVREAGERGGFEAALRAPPFAVVVPDDAALALFRIAQEALNNAVKHSQADQVHVEVSADEDGLRLEVRDDGRGLGHEPGAGTFGLAGMRERVALLDGTLDVVPPAGGGLAVRVWLPLRAPSR